MQPESSSSAPRPPRPRRWLFAAAAAGLGMLASLGIVELGLRIAGVSHPVFARHDPILGTSLAPGVRGHYTSEGDARVSINSQGLRDREHEFAAPPGTFRIAILGDSYAEALQVDATDAFWAVLERELANCPSLRDRQIECINFGVSGYGTAQELLMLRHVVWEYQPDLVLLAFTTGNDVSDNVRELKRVDYIPYFIWQDGELVLDDSFLTSNSYTRRASPMVRVLRFCIRYSRLAQVANHARYQLRVVRRRGARAEQDEASAGEIGLDDQIYIPQPSDLLRQAWRTTEELVAIMGREVESRGARFALVTLSSGIQVTPDSEARTRFQSSLGVDDLFYADERIAALGRREGFPVLNLAPLFQSEAEASGTYFHGFGDNPGGGHWNENGHRRGGELMAEWLCEILAPTQGNGKTGQTDGIDRSPRGGPTAQGG